MRRVVVPLCAVVSLSACAGDDASPDRQPATTGTTIEAGVSTTVGVSDDDEGIGGVEATLATLLIAAGELGDPSFVDAGYTPAEEPTICGFAVDDAVAPTTLVGSVSESTELGVTVRHELRGYGDVDDAAEAIAMTRAACDGAGDVTAEVGGDEAFSITTGTGVVVAAQVTDVVATFEIIGDGVDPHEVAAFGVGKLLAFIERGS